MALTTVTTNLVEQKWDNDFFTSYVRANRFKRYMGTSENSIIQVKEQLVSNPGDRIHLALISELSGAGQTGDGLLEGNEEALGQYEFPIAVSTIRHAVAVTDNQQQFTGIGLRDAAKEQLKNWAMKKVRNDILTALGSIGGIAYASATAGQRNTWYVANADRVLIGNGATGAAGAVLATDLALVTSAMTLSKSIVSKMKGKAEVASPIIRPVTVGEDEENYVMFVGAGAFRDLKADLESNNRDAMDRGKENPLFRDGDLLHDGVVIRKIAEIATLGTVGASSARLEPVYLCGAQALAYAIAQRTKSTTETRDYGFVKGVGIHEMRGILKTVFNSKDHGVLSGFVAAAAV